MTSASIEIPVNTTHYAMDYDNLLLICLKMTLLKGFRYFFFTLMMIFYLTSAELFFIIRIAIFLFMSESV